MNLNEIPKSKGAAKRRKRLGRGHGSGKGKTSGKGHKGQMSRSGHKHKPTFEGGQNRLVTSIPIRGFTNFTRKAYTPVNVGSLDVFDAGTEVTVELLREKGILNGPKNTLVKVLGDGDLSRKLTVKVNGFSKSAREKIEAAGGTCEVV